MAAIRLSDPELFSVLSPSPSLVLVAAAAFVLGVAQGAGVAISLPWPSLLAWPQHPA